MGNYYSYSQINSPSHDVSPIIHFGSLVFEHQGDFDLQLTWIYDPDLTCSGHEVFASFSQIPEDLADSAAHLDLDYDGSDEEARLILMKAVRSTWPHGIARKQQLRLGHQHHDHRPILVMPRRLTQFWHEH